MFASPFSSQSRRRRQSLGRAISLTRLRLPPCLRTGTAPASVVCFRAGIEPAVRLSPPSVSPPSLSLCPLIARQRRRCREPCAGAGGGRGAAGGVEQGGAPAAPASRGRRAASRAAAAAARWGLFPLHSPLPPLPLSAFLARRPGLF
jgi:hypothetical protein